ncbi:hypothetical protein ACFY3U_17725 [Micromonospora sp. NPDC000089]|uniref:hypothetical protein n=1 Tax=unclassified Micromonospora TaxID=2617518 RepID=UPI00367B439B
MRGSAARRAIVGALLASGLLLSGCAVHEAAPGDAERLARQQARDRLDELTAAIDRDRPWQADEFGRLVAGRDQVELVALDGTTRGAGDGVSLVVRTHGEATTKTWDGADDGHAEVALCHRLRYRSDAVDPVTEVECPAGAPVTPRPAATLPAGVDERLRRELPTGSAATEASVGALLDRMRLDPRVRRDVATLDGHIGLALRADRRGSCLLARVVGDRVEVWRPSAVQLQPGELSCSAETAASGQGQRSPH